MIYLLDVNALLAFAHETHVHHRRAEEWVRTLRRADKLATCSITELGFVRIAPHARLSPNLTAARDLLNRLFSAGPPKFIRLADDLGADSLPAWVKTPAQTTDGHLVALAVARAARLATLDDGIPESLVIPRA